MVYVRKHQKKQKNQICANNGIRFTLLWIIFGIIVGLVAGGCIVDDVIDRGFHGDAKSPNYGETPPSLSITWPLDGMTLPTHFTMLGTAMDDVEVISISYRLDGAETWVPITNAANWTVPITSNPGTHKLEVKATDNYEQNAETIEELSIFCQATGDTEPITTEASESATHPDIAFEGDFFGMIWQDKTGADYNLQFATRKVTAPLAADGTLIPLEESMLVTPPYEEITVSSASGDQINPSIAASDGIFGCVYEDYRNSGTGADIYFNTIQVEDDGLVLGSELEIVKAAGEQTEPKLAVNDSGWGVVWVDDRDGNYDIYFRFIDSNGLALGTETVLCQDVSDQTDPTICAHPYGFMIAWSDAREADKEIMAISVDTNEHITSMVYKITDNIDSDESKPDIIHNGTEFGVVWESDSNSGDVYFAVMNNNGIIDDVSIPLSALPHQETNPVVSAMGDDFIITWEDNRNGNIDLYFQRRSDDEGVFFYRISESLNDDKLQEIAVGGFLVGAVWSSGSSPNQTINFNWQVP